MGSRHVLKLLLGKNEIIANNLATTEAREKISTDLKPIEF
jgi:hypothetical protein